MGPPGCGKTSIGKILGRKLDKQVIDVDDDFLEPYWGVSVAEKLSELGDDKFLLAEGEALMNFPYTLGKVICLSGSNPLHPRSMEHISQMSSVIIYIDVPLDTIVNRMHVMKINRIIGHLSGKSLREILHFRTEFYENSYHIRVIVTDGEDVESIVEKVLLEIGRNQSYRSTRGWIGGEVSEYESQRQGRHDFLDVVRTGLAPDGGLFVPSSWTSFNLMQLGRLLDLSYQERALRVMEKFPLGSFRPFIFRKLINQAYETFDVPSIIPITRIDCRGQQFLMELYHGPTASFKDLSLQLTPKILLHAISVVEGNSGIHNDVGLIVATSGDTGTAALDGFSRELGIPVIVLYPAQGVSTVQKHQMMTASKKTLVIGVDSDFDFCQNLVKVILEKQTTLLSPHLGYKHGSFNLTSANSINFGRFLPQVVFTVSAYLEMVKSGKIQVGQEVDVTVPTGNFGNILGVVMARRLGIPIGQLICASNSNNILTDFINSGRYQLNGRTFMKTFSPSIDILVSSNLERFLYLLYLEQGADHQEAGHKVSEHFKSLKTSGTFLLPPGLAHAVSKELKGGWCNEIQCIETIRKVKTETNIMIDPHTAVAKFVADHYQREGVPMLIASTANFAKFPEAMMKAMKDTSTSHLTVSLSELFELLRDEHNPIPSSLRLLAHKPVNHSLVMPASQDEIIHQINSYLTQFFTDNK
eukprot:TRINITY_DN6893_c0_g2_i5.p1 TRINITY_DN6893_c0_g2~~TRINITY_DN6893_c0_g2_i5.p1  ORF type:complete len:764 (-),score=110.97 TRINITY_DN6893_c0_g2_i5:39-2132(-)